MGSEMCIRDSISISTYLETDSSITILSDISLDAHCINVIVVSRVTVVLEVLFLSAQSMVLCLMHVTRGHAPASDSVPPVWIGL